MRPDRITLCALAAAFAAALTGEPFAQGPTAGTPSMATPAPAGTTALPPGAPATQPARPRTDATSPQRPAPAATQPSASRGLATNPPAVDVNAPTTATGSGIGGGVPAMSGITPNRAELAGSAFTKLDGASRGYLTLDDVRQLDGFESAFRQADQNGDGRLNASEFNSAWGVYTGNVR